jgi:Holliday junction resolvasome RuvABC endonuclease subunit
MTVTDERIRQRLRREVKPRKSAWEPPDITEFALGIRVLCWDPSLLHTGFVDLVRYGWGFEVVAHKTFNMKSSEKIGYRKIWSLATQLREEIVLVYARLEGRRELSFCHTAVESPYIGSGKRTESALIAGLQVWDVAHHVVFPARLHAVSASHVSSVLCGNVAHDKKEIAAAVQRYIPESGGRGWSEHQRDAAAVGLTLLHDDLRHGEDPGDGS